MPQILHALRWAVANAGHKGRGHPEGEEFRRWLWEDRPAVMRLLEKWEGKWAKMKAPKGGVPEAAPPPAEVSGAAAVPAVEAVVGDEEAEALVDLIDRLLGRGEVR